MIMFELENHHSGNYIEEGLEGDNRGRKQKIGANVGFK